MGKEILHLQRGYVYEIAGQSFFVMGGCRSSAKWAEMGLWYEGEEPSAEELSRAYVSLAAHGNTVDYVLTHKYASELKSDDRETLEGLWAYLDESVTYRRWYAGHCHKSQDEDERHTFVYDLPIPLGQSVAEATLREKTE